MGCERRGSGYEATRSCLADAGATPSESRFFCQERVDLMSGVDGVIVIESRKKDEPTSVIHSDDRPRPSGQRRCCDDTPIYHVVADRLALKT